jgi:5-methylcytosine-specific restriction enzyme A
MSTRWGTQRTASTSWRKLRARVLERDEYRCQIADAAICTGTAETVDHLVPAFRGGSDAEENLQSACWPCHRRKTGQEAAAAKPQRQRPPDKHPGLL